MSVKVYSTTYCPFCVAAKNLLKQKGISFEEIMVDGDQEKRRWLVDQTGQTTVPQIFIHGQSIGGFQELAQLEDEGKLDKLINKE